jgi:hypothetical protein
MLNTILRLTPSLRPPIEGLYRSSVFLHGAVTKGSDPRSFLKPVHSGAALRMGRTWAVPQSHRLYEDGSGMEVTDEDPGRGGMEQRARSVDPSMGGIEAPVWSKASPSPSVPVEAS